jgi:hypothetical protein
VNGPEARSIDRASEAEDLFEKRVEAVVACAHAREAERMFLSHSQIMGSV